MKLLNASEVEERIAKTISYTSAQDSVLAISSAKLAHDILDEIIQRVRPGVSESQIKEYSLECFAKYKVERTWHPPYVRFGDHTLLTFLDKAKEDYTLNDSDIAFVDIGIVKNGIEGDAGRTVAFGENATLKELSSVSKTIFDQAKAYWKNNNPTGKDLYDFIYSLAHKGQVLWNLDPAGHLIGEFPHRGWKQGLNHFPESIDSGRWILEIQVRHPDLPYGSFYEDLLY